MNNELIYIDKVKHVNHMRMNDQMCAISCEAFHCLKHLKLHPQGHLFSPQSHSLIPRKLVKKALVILLEQLAK